MQWDLVFKLELGQIGSDQNWELERQMFFDNMELIKVDVREDLELVLLDALALELGLWGKGGSGVGHRLVVDGLGTLW